MSETEQHDEAWRAQDCLAKAAYVAWVASITADSQCKKFICSYHPNGRRKPKTKAPTTSAIGAEFGSL